MSWRVSGREPPLEGSNPRARTASDPSGVRPAPCPAPTPADDTWTADAPFRLFKRDMAVRVQGWGIGGSYQTMNPFGGPSRADGAAI